MNVVTRKHPVEAQARFPDAAKEIQAWYMVAKAAKWQNFEEVRRVFTDADNVDGYVIFNIRRNRYRLITVIHYSRTKDGRITDGHVYIRAVLTHKEYDNRSNWEKGIRT